MTDRPKNVREAAYLMKSIIDSYWIRSISEQEAVTQIKSILCVPENRILVLRGEGYTAVFEKVMGKKRLDTFIKLCPETW